MTLRPPTFRPSWTQSLRNGPSLINDICSVLLFLGLCTYECKVFTLNFFLSRIERKIMRSLYSILGSEGMSDRMSKLVVYRFKTSWNSWEFYRFSGEVLSLCSPAWVHTETSSQAYCSFSIVMAEWLLWNIPYIYLWCVKTPVH